MAGPIVVYCRSGNRSGMAQMLLKQAGLTEVYNGGGLHDGACHGLKFVYA
ncbi:MAG: rhodanese-like domain-containing protein [Aquirufa sp.]